MSTLGDVKNPCTSSKLVIRHALLTSIVKSTKNNTSLRQKVCVLSVHHHNISLTVKHHRHMNFIGIFSWTLSRMKRRLDCLNIATIAILQAWWVVKTKISPNKKKVTRK